MLDFIDTELNERKAQGLYRSLRCVEGHQGAKVTIDGKECINLCSNNYLGLANNPQLKKAAIEASQKYGSGSGASRLVCGTLKLHRELENSIARFKNKEAALVFNSGYVANLGIITALVGRGDVCISDKLNHASIVDGALLSRAEFKRYAHNDMNALRKCLEASKDLKKRLIVTDTVFSMDGDLAPLVEIVALAKEYGAMIMVDEAHAAGVFGENGRGLVELLGLEDDCDIQMGTLSKAFGAFGAYVTGSKGLIEYFVNKSRPFIYTTALPPSVLASCIAAIEVVKSQAWMRKQLWSNISLMKRGLIDSGFTIMKSESQIIPILVGDSQRSVEFSKALFEEGVFIQAIRPPTVPRNEARLRLTVTAAHKNEDLKRSLETIGKVGKKIGIIS